VSGIVVSEEVRAALEAGVGVVALETSMIGQGLPSPANRRCAEEMTAAVRGARSVPAWIGIVDGAPIVGLSEAQLARFFEPGAAVKVARRDLPSVCVSGALGATTVSATIWAAARTGVDVAATGGIGGVHPGESPDVSADLLELARTPGLLVCSGPKSIVDPTATAERLEELGVAVVGYGVDRLPFFLAREAPVALEHRVDSAVQAAAVLGAARDLGVRSTILLCYPVPAASAMGAEEVAAAAAEAEVRADRAGVRGKARTPFLLATLATLTQGRSLEANLVLLGSNARLAGEIAAVAAPSAR
jgi:pseudouridine-5'-phosphate glycosidase